MRSIIRKLLGKIPYSSFGLSNEPNRDAWVEKTLKKIPGGLRLLDAGAGEQKFKKYCTHLNYVSQDFAQYKPEEKKEGLQMETWDYGKLDIISDIASIPEPDKSFDAILCTEVFEHIVNPIEAIKEFARLLKPGGHAIITAPFCSLTHFAPYHFYSGFNTYFYEKCFKDSGFEIIEMTPNGNYFEYIAQEMQRLPAIASKYSKHSVNKNDQRIISESIQLLEKISANEKGSSELLNNGWQVFAKKI
ncbi:MAG TPA: methyltransferase domain-containing protein [Bacteroidia bacterium]|nr:methyltransferase domain-containing protein [Bacteroidia bacterium]